MVLRYLTNLDSSYPGHDIREYTTRRTSALFSTSVSLATHNIILLFLVLKTMSDTLFQAHYSMPSYILCAFVSTALANMALFQKLQNP